MSKLIPYICVIMLHTPYLLNGQSNNTILNNPVELGQVNWLRNYDQAIRQSVATGLPVLILFQEVPGCANCTNYGRNVLSHPFAVEMIESHFIPLAIYNNKGGDDRKILQQFNEPSWNNPVIRIINDKGIDMIPRLSGDFSQYGLANKMTSALALSAQTIPEYFSIWKTELEGSNDQEEAYLAMYCFWTGEKEIAKISGVLSTEAGYMHGKEVVKVLFDKKSTNIDRIVKVARSKDCADEVFMEKGSAASVGTRPTGTYRKDKEVKYYLLHSKYKELPLTPLQAARVNSALGEGLNPEIYISPRQLALLELSGEHRKKQLQAFNKEWFTVLY